MSEPSPLTTDQLINRARSPSRRATASLNLHCLRFTCSLVTVVVERQTQAITVTGAARQVRDIVIMNDKDHDGVGKDVRTWVRAERDGAARTVPGAASSHPTRRSRAGHRRGRQA